MTARFHSARTLLLLLLAALAFGASAHGQTTYSWTSGSGAFSGSANWSNSVVPATDGTAVLDFSPTATLSYSATNDIPAVPLPLTGFTFNGNSTGSVTIFTGSNNFQLGAGNQGITQNGSTPVSFISTTGGTVGSAILVAASDITIGGSGTGTITIGGATDTPVVSGSGNINVNFSVPGTSSNPNLLLGNIGAAAYTGNLNVLGGYVKCNRTGGNMFDSSTILTVNSGSTFDFNSNGEGLGGLQGAGTIVGNANFSFSASGDRTWSGSIQGSETVTQSALATWYLGGSNTYTKGTTLTAGTIQLNSATALPSTGVLSFTGASTVLNANGFSPTVTGLSSTTPACSLLLGSSTLTINTTTSNTFSGAITGSGSVIKGGTGLQAFAASSFAGGASLAVTAGSVQLLGGGGNFAPVFSSSANTSLGWIGPGTLTLGGTNAFSGSTLTVASGNFTIDDTANNSAKLGGQPSISLLSGTLALLGNGSLASSETASSLTIGGAAKLTVTTGMNQNASLSLGTITQLGGATLNASLNNVGSGTASVTTTSTNGVTGLTGGFAILGGNVVINGTDWATVNGNGTLTAVSSAAYSNAVNSNAWGATLLNSVTASNSSLTASSTTAALRFNSPGANTITMSGGSNAIVSGGILVTPNVSSNNSTISGGTLAAPNGSPLYVGQYNTAGLLTISSTISDTTRSASASGTFATSSIQVAVPTAGLYPGETVSGLGIATNTRILAITGTNSLVLSLVSTASKTSTPLTFGGGTMIVKSGPGTLVLSGINKFTGGVVLNEGTVNYSNTSHLGTTASPVVFNGGTLNYTTASGLTDAHPWLFAQSGGTVNVAQGNGSVLAKSGSDVYGFGNLTKTGSATLSIGSKPSTFSGQIFLNQGALRVTSSQLESCTGVTVANGGEYLINDTGNGTYQFASGAVMTLNGSFGNSGNQNSTGAFAVALQGTNVACPVSTFTNAINLATDSLFTTDSTGGSSGTTTLKLTGQISGPGNMIIGGNGLPGIVQVSNATNGYGGSSGSTTVQGGVLQLGAANALPAATNLVMANANTAAVFDLNGFTQTVASLTTTNFSNNTVLSSAGTGAVLTVNYSGSAATLYSGNLGSSGTNNNFGFATSGSGVVVLDGNNYYTQGTSIGAGSTLQLGNLDGQGNINGNIINSGSLSFNFGNGFTQVSTSANISGTGAVINQSNAAVILAGTNTFSGAALIQKGTFVVPSTGTSHLPSTANVTLGSAAGNSGILQLGDNSGPVSQTLSTLSSIGSGSSNAVVGGYASSNSTLNVNSTSDATYGGGLGTATGSFFAQYNTLALLKSGTATLTLSGSNNCAGPTTVNAGVLQAGSSSAFSSISALTVNSAGTLRTSGNSVAIASLSGVGTVENANATPGLLTVLGAGNTGTTFSGLIRDGAGGGALALYKTGTGMLTLANNNTYTGATTVNGGTLALFGATTQASPFTIANGAALAVSTSANTVVLGSALTLGASSGDTAMLDFNVQGSWSTSAPMLSVSGALTTAGTTSINLASAFSPPVGTYPLINLSGSVLGSGSGAFMLGSLPSARVQATLLDVNSMLELNVTSSDSPKWTGAQGNVWDVSTANWALLSSGGTTTFFQGDNVLFDDSATGPTGISLNQTVSPNTVLFNNNSLVYSVSGSGKMSGLGSLAVSGSAGVLLLTDNDYTAGTTISAGTLQLGNGGTTGSVVGAITNNAMLAFNRSDNPTFAGAISGSGQVALLGGGQITLTGSNTYAGPTNVTAGTLQIGGGGNSGSISSDVVNNGALLFSRSDTWTYPGAISGSGSVTQAGPGAVVFTGNHSYSGSTTITGGTLQLGGGGTSGGIATDVTLANNSTLAFNRSDSVTYGGVVSGNGNLAQQGPGNLTLTGSNMYSQGTQVNGGTLTVANAYNLSPSSGNLSFNGGTLRLAGPLSLSQAVFLNTAGGTIDTNGNNMTSSGQISGGNLVKNGAGTLTLTNGSNYFNSGTSTWTVNNGAISIDSYLEVSATTMALNGGTLQTTGAMGSPNNPLVTTGTEFPSSVVVQVGANGATLDTGSNWFTTMGAFSGGTATTLNKFGSGTWYARGGLGAFLGNVNILAGTLLDDPASGVSPAGSLDAASNSTVITVAAGATWDDSWGNGETMGGIAGAGTILTPVGKGLSFQTNVVTTFSGVIHSGSQSVAIPSGNSTLALGSGGILTLTSSASDFGGQSTINSGTLIVSAAVLNNVNGPLGNASSEILLGNTSTANNASLLSDTPGVEIGRDVRLQSGNTGISSIGGLNTSGTVTYSGGIYLGTNTAAARPLTVVAASGGTVLISGQVTRPTGATGAADVVTINGPGAVILSNSNNSYSGGTVLNSGTLVVSNPAGSVTGTGKLTLNGGTLASSSAGIVGGNLLAGPAVIAPGGIGTIGSLAIGGSVSLSSASVLDFDINGGSYDTLNITGILNETGTAIIDLNTIGSLTSSYTLATFASSPGLTFTASGLPSNYHLSTTNNGLLLIPNATGPAAWNMASSGSWSATSNWSSNSAPSGAGQAAVVAAATTASWTITLDGPQTLGTLTFGNSLSNTAGYTVAAGTSGGLTLDNSGSPAAIIVSGGSHSIAASVPITLNGNLVVAPTAGSTLEIDGNIAENPPGSGQTLTLNDGGTLILGGSNNFSGGTTVAAGTLIIDNSEALADGSSLTVGDASSFSSAPVVLGSVAGVSGLNESAIAAVPEPSTLALFGLAAVLAVLLRKRRGANS